MEVLEIIKNTYIIIVLQFILVNVLILNKEHYKNQNSYCISQEKIYTFMGATN